MKNIWNPEDTRKTLERIDTLRPESKPVWGTMSVGQMLAHCNVSYEMVYGDNHAKPNPILRFILKVLVKGAVVNEKPYKHNSRTGPQFVIKETKDFASEKNRLVAYVLKTQQLGEAHFHGKESLSFGPLQGKEWNNMFYKHLDHHLSQFGA
ncbi:MAG: DUF1569 domain-containing protein [Fibrobacterota bacterium]|nr:DUF1569 domain-containing protein [Fibrobacterota bacterium]